LHFAITNSDVISVLLQATQPNGEEPIPKLVTPAILEAKTIILREKDYLKTPTR